MKRKMITLCILIVLFSNMFVSVGNSYEQLYGIHAIDRNQALDFSQDVGTLRNNTDYYYNRFEETSQDYDYSEDKYLETQIEIEDITNLTDDGYSLYQTYKDGKECIRMRNNSIGLGISSDYRSRFSFGIPEFENNSYNIQFNGYTDYINNTDSQLQIDVYNESLTGYECRILLGYGDSGNGISLSNASGSYFVGTDFIVADSFHNIIIDIKEGSHINIYSNGNLFTIPQQLYNTDGLVFGTDSYSNYKTSWWITEPKLIYSNSVNEKVKEYTFPNNTINNSVYEFVPNYHLSKSIVNTTIDLRNGSRTLVDDSEIEYNYLDNGVFTNNETLDKFIDLNTTDIGCSVYINSSTNIGHNNYLQMNDVSGSDNVYIKHNLDNPSNEFQMEFYGKFEGWVMLYLVGTLTEQILFQESANQIGIYNGASYEYASLIGLSFWNRYTIYITELEIIISINGVDFMRHDRQSSYIINDYRIITADFSTGTSYIDGLDSSLDNFYYEGRNNDLNYSLGEYNEEFVFESLIQTNATDLAFGFTEDTSNYFNFTINSSFQDTPILFEYGLEDNLPVLKLTQFNNSNISIQYNGYLTSENITIKIKGSCETDFYLDILGSNSNFRFKEFDYTWANETKYNYAYNRLFRFRHYYQTFEVFDNMSYTSIHPNPILSKIYNQSFFIEDYEIDLTEFNKQDSKLMYLDNLTYSVPSIETTQDLYLASNRTDWYNADFSTFVVENYRYWNKNLMRFVVSSNATGVGQLVLYGKRDGAGNTTILDEQIEIGFVHNAISIRNFTSAGSYISYSSITCEANQLLTFIISVNQSDNSVAIDIPQIQYHANFENSWVNISEYACFKIAPITNTFVFNGIEDQFTELKELEWYSSYTWDIAEETITPPYLDEDNELYFNQMVSSKVATWVNTSAVLDNPQVEYYKPISSSMDFEELDYFELVGLSIFEQPNYTLVKPKDSINHAHDIEMANTLDNTYNATTKTTNLVDQVIVKVKADNNVEYNESYERYAEDTYTREERDEYNYSIEDVEIEEIEPENYTDWADRIISDYELLGSVVPRSSSEIPRHALEVRFDNPQINQDQIDNEEYSSDPYYGSFKYDSDVETNITSNELVNEHELEQEFVIIWELYIYVKETSLFDVVINSILPFALFFIFPYLFRNYGNGKIGIYIGTILAFIVMIYTDYLTLLNGIILIVMSFSMFLIMSKRAKNIDLPRANSFI